MDLEEILLTDEEIRQAWHEDDIARLNKAGVPSDTRLYIAYEYAAVKEEDRAIAKAQAKRVFSELTKVGKLIIDGPRGNIKTMGLEIPWEKWEAFRQEIGDT